MIVTGITEKNEFAFDGAIGGFWENRSANQTFWGLVDDDDNAVGAAVLENTGPEIDLRYFAIAEEHRGRGYGKYFLDYITHNMNKDLFSEVTCCLFTEGKDEFLSFLEHNGFEVLPAGGRRNIYDLFDILSEAPYSRGSVSNDERIIPARLIDDDLTMKILGLEEEIETKGGVFDTERFLSKDNVYGGLLMKGDEISAMICVSPFHDGIRIESMFSNNGEVDKVMHLFDHAIGALRALEDIPEKLYIDSAGESVMAFEDTLMGRKDIEAEKSLTAMIAVGALQ